MYIIIYMQDINEDDIQAVVNVLKSDCITRGKTRDDFEYELIKFSGYNYCISVVNGSVALDIALAVLFLPVGAKIGVCPLTFSADINCIQHNRYIPVFLDCDSSGCIDPHKIDKLLDAIICVDFAGHSCDYLEIRKSVGDIPIIQDSAHSFGIPKSEFVNIQIASFHPLKIITTGEGGCILTDNQKYAIRSLVLRNNGLNFKSQPTFVAGYNAHLSDINCALGLSQMKRIKDFLKIREKNARLWKEYLQHDYITFLDDLRDNSYHFVPAIIKYEKLRDELLTLSPMLKINYPIYSCYRIDTLNAGYYSDHILSLPTGTKLKLDEIKNISDSIIKKCQTFV